MAVSSDDWPRFSLLAGASTCAITPANEEINQKLIHALSSPSSFTCECWLQLRTPKKRITTDGDCRLRGCWVVYSPQWACGINSAGRIAVYQGKAWYTTVSNSQMLRERRWYHLAVSYGAKEGILEMHLDGEPVSLQIPSKLDDTTGGNKIVDEPPYCGLRLHGNMFHIAYTPNAENSISIIVHEFRLWSCIVPRDVLQSWSVQTHLDHHPLISKLFAHWAFSSGTFRNGEMDLSGNGHHVCLQRINNSHRGSSWLCLTPSALRPESNMFILSAWKDTSTISGICRFAVAVNYRHKKNDSWNKGQTARRCPVILFLLNFLFIKSSSIVKKDEGQSVVALLKECVSNLPDETIVGFRIPATGKQEGLVVPLTHMTTAGKSHVMKRLDQLAIAKLGDAIDLIHSIKQCLSLLEGHNVNARIDAEAEQRSELSFYNIVVINGCDLEDASYKMLTSALREIEDTFGAWVNNMNIYILHMTSYLNRQQDGDSRFYFEYFTNASNLEWALSAIINRVRSICCKHGRLQFDVVGDGSIQLDSDGSNRMLRLQNIETNSFFANVGLCEESESFFITGIFANSKEPQQLKGDGFLPFVEVSFSYMGYSKRCHVVRTAIRLNSDMANEFHVERVHRNKRLVGNSDISLLLEQRCQLMGEKRDFHVNLLLREFAEAENTFKRIDVMKEELWAKQQWIYERGLRLFEEDKIFKVQTEELTNVAQFHQRLELLHAQYTIDVRESSRGNNGSDGVKRIKLDSYTPKYQHISNDQADDNADEFSMNAEEAEEKYQKLTLRADFLIRQFDDMELQLKNTLKTVRLAEHKSTTIMNDSIKNWMMKYRDLIHTKQEIMLTTLLKNKTSHLMYFLEQKQAATARTTNNIKAVNSLILRYEKEHIKRRKRIIVCMKDMFSSVKDEFTHASSVKVSKQALTQCRLMSSPSLYPEVYSSCILVFFPLEHSQRETPSNVSQAAVNVVHSILYGLRYFCHEATQEPLCRRVSCHESFLWLAYEQGDSKVSNDIFTVNKKQVYQQCWAVIFFTYNAMFTSPTAVREMKETLLVAKQMKKPILNIQLEPLLPGLEEFKQAWIEPPVLHEGIPIRLCPVEKEYLMWKQNVAFFQSTIRDIDDSTSSSLRFPLSTFACDICGSRASQNSLNELVPCLSCCWPFVSRSSRVIGLASETNASLTTSVESTNDTVSSFTDVVHFISKWVNGIPSTSIPFAVRNYQLDPKDVSPLSIKWEEILTAKLRDETVQWEKSFANRKQDMEKIIQKLFKVYEEEALELTNLESTLLKRKQSSRDVSMEQLSNYRAEIDIIKSIMVRKCKDDKLELPRRAREVATMVEEDVRQHIHETDAWMMEEERLQETEEMSDASNAPVMDAKHIFHQLLAQTCRKIANVGRQLVEYQLQKMTKQLDMEEQLAHIDHYDFLRRFEEDELIRAENMYDDALHIAHDLIAEQETKVVDDARSLWEISQLLPCKFSSAIFDCDMVELDKHSLNMQNQNAFQALILTDTQVAGLRMCVAKRFLKEVHAARVIFQSFFTPSSALAIDGDYSQREQFPADITKLKEVCAVSLDYPANTWDSLEKMAALIEMEVQLTHQANLRCCAQKMRFHNEFMGATLRQNGEFNQSYLNHLQEQLVDADARKNNSFHMKEQNAKQLRAVIEDREQCKRRMVLLQAKLMEIKESNHFALDMLKTCRGSYERATNVIEQLQNYKMDPIYKTWHAVGGFHVSCIGDLYDVRSKSSEIIEELEREIAMLERQMDRFNGVAENRRTEWINESIVDIQLYERVEKIQDCAHDALEQVIEAEERRVFHLLSCFDARGTWLQKGMIQQLHHQSGASWNIGIDDTLVQLSIARLDVIRQEKQRDALVRKLHVLERLRKQEAEKKQLFIDELDNYQELHALMLKRVDYINNQLSQVTQGLTSLSGDTVQEKKALSLSREQIRTSVDTLKALSIMARKDHLAAEARLCHIKWQIQEQTATDYRIEALINELTAKIAVADNYLALLKQDDEHLRVQGIETATASLFPNEGWAKNCGIDLRLVQLVFEYYASQQWSKQALNETTVIGERIFHLKEQLGAKTSESEFNEAEQASAISAIGKAQLKLLVNRFECRVAEQTSDALRAIIDARVAGALSSLSYHNHQLDEILAKEESAATVLSLETLENLFSWKICHKQKEALNNMLRRIATIADPRDTAGSISEVIFGASLGRNDIKQIYYRKSKAYVDEQWKIVLVVLFFARLFRRSALKKAARKRKAEASKLATITLARLAECNRIAQFLRKPDAAQNLQTICKSVAEMHDQPLEWRSCMMESIRLWQLEIQETERADFLITVSDGLRTSRPLHVSLASLFDPHHNIRLLAHALTQARMRFENRPPIPTDVELLSVTTNTIKIKWRPYADDQELVYAAEIQAWQPTGTTTQHWDRFLCDEKTRHTFYNLQPLGTYCVRIRIGFSKTNWGFASTPIFVSLASLT